MKLAILGVLCVTAVAVAGCTSSRPVRTTTGAPPVANTTPAPEVTPVTVYPAPVYPAGTTATTGVYPSGVYPYTSPYPPVYPGTYQPAFPPSYGLTQTDVDFVRNAAAGSAFEIDLSRLAYVRAQNPAVRDFAWQMIVDHRRLTNELDEAALRGGYLIAWQPAQQTGATLDRLSRSQGSDFDRAYMDQMVADHAGAVALYQTQQARGGAPDLRNMASQALPTLRQHQTMAQAVRNRL